MFQWTDWIIAIFTGIIAAVTTAYAVFSRLQWLAMRDQANKMKSMAETARQTAEATRESVRNASTHAQMQLRAYITIKSGFVQIHEDARNVPTAVIVFRNSGQTPAYNVRAGIAGGAGSFPWGNNYEVPPVLPNKSVIGPDETFERRFRWAEPLPAETRDLLTRSRDIAIWAVGRIEYRDAFGGPGDEPRWLTFRQFCRGPLEIGIRHPFSPDADGNDTSEDQ